jgi:adenylate cyclase
VTLLALPALARWRRRFARLRKHQRIAPLARALEDAFNPPVAPERVVGAIRQAEADAEILVGWVQLAGVAVFAVLYVASHAAFRARMGFEPVPVLLTIYTAFVLWRMRCAYRGTLTARLLSISAIADVIVFMATIWSFTLQYNQPAALYLKAPTLLYAFILIALRALRYDPGHVLLTGLLAAAGWFVLTMIAATSGAPETNDYLVYLTSLSVFWGAEFEKIVAITAMTAVLALAVSRARTLLIRTAIEEKAAAELSRFLDPAAARQVRGALSTLEAGDGKLKHAAIMFLDLRGFSNAAASLPPSAVISLLKDYQTRFVPIIEAAGGGVDKYMGDGILVSFGTGRQTGKEAAEAMACLPALLAAADDWRAERDALGLPRLEVAIAIATGEVVHGVIGAEDRLEFTVIGDAVNLAAKLEKHAKVEHARVLATRNAYDRARAQGDATPALRAVTGARVEGVNEPIDLVVLA